MTLGESIAFPASPGSSHCISSRNNKPSELQQILINNVRKGTSNSRVFSPQYFPLFYCLPHLVTGSPEKVPTWQPTPEKGVKYRIRFTEPNRDVFGSVLFPCSQVLGNAEMPSLTSRGSFRYKSSQMPIA
uniref:Uncharacterized protein n=1 Tax=Sphaerodactylus townsendi TaxID=933632 RepID=A0ACB8E610_9SAUR